MAVMKDPISERVAQFTTYVCLRSFKAHGKQWYRGEVVQTDETWIRVKELVSQRYLAPLPATVQTIEHDGRHYVDVQFVPRVSNGKDDANAFRVEKHSAQEVLDFVADNMHLLEDVIAAEEAGRARSTLLSQLYPLRETQQEPEGATSG